MNERLCQNDKLSFQEDDSSKLKLSTDKNHKMSIDDR